MTATNATRTLRVLIVEDDDADAELLIRALEKGSVSLLTERVETPEEMSAALEKATWDVVVSDYHMPRFSAPEAFALLQSKGLDIPFIIVSGTVGEEIAVQAMKLGVNDYLLKGNLTRLLPVIEREIRERESRAAKRRAEQALKDAEEHLAQAQKMEAIGSLAGGIAHDFNNLLSVILSYTSFVLSELPAGDPLRDDLLEVKKAGERAAELTRQLLAFSRRQVLQPRVLDLNQTVLGAEKMLRRVLGEDVRLTLDLANPIGKIHADPGQLEQVLMNLVVNARDAMPRGGLITIQTRNVDLDPSRCAGEPSSQPRLHVMLAVSDTGVGMDKATRSRIFEPFFTTKEKGRGTGLGLSTVFGIVTQSGGLIEVDSAPGQGSTFRVYLPRAEGEAASETRLSAGPATLRGAETILLVEDDAQVRTVSSAILRRMGYNVLEAQNGGDASLVCEKHEGEIHLLVTDVVMPWMSGRELAERLTKVRPKMKVLYVSGYTDDAIVRHGVVRDGVPFLNKPFTPEILAKKVRDVLDAK